MRKFRHSGRQLLSARAWRTRLAFWGGAVVVGLAAVMLADGAELADGWFRGVVHDHPLLTFLLTPLGFALAVWLTRAFFQGAQGSGIPQTMAALDPKHAALRDTLLTFRIAVGKGLMVLLGLASGASIGREGPTVHIGAAIMNSLRKVAHFPHHDLSRGLVVAGGAAGVAAAFNTPLAGLVFAIEELSRTYEQKVSGTVLLAILVAGVVSVGLLGNYDYFGRVITNVAPIDLLTPALAAGVVGGVLGGGFTAALIYGVRRAAPWQRSRPLTVALLLGLAMATLGYLSGGAVYGTGYGEAKALLAGEGGGGLLYALEKGLATLVSYWSGIPGGLFAPSLSVGAGLGGALAGWFPHIAFPAVALLGMAGYFSGVMQTPITAAVILMEMTDDQAIFLPLLGASLIASGISRHIAHTPIYHALMETFLANLPAAKDSDQTVR
ncbi:chloride channel protein [Endothiovibrio diazotrophicus]